MIILNGAFALINKIGQAAPATIPRLNRFAAGTMAARTYTTAAHQVFVSPRRVRFVEDAARGLDDERVAIRTTFWRENGVEFTTASEVAGTF